MFTNLIQHESISPICRLHLTHHIVGILHALEGHMPTLDLLIQTARQFHCVAAFDGAVRQFHQDWRQCSRHAAANIARLEVAS